MRQIHQIHWIRRIRRVRQVRRIRRIRVLKIAFVRVDTKRYKKDIYADFWQTKHLQFTSFQFLIIFLEISLFSNVLMWYGEVFHILGPRLRILFVPNLTWQILRISKFKLIFFANRTSRSFKNFFNKTGKRLFRDLDISLYKVLRFRPFNCFSDLSCNITFIRTVIILL